MLAGSRAIRKHDVVSSPKESRPQNGSQQPGTDNNIGGPKLKRLRYAVWQLDPTPMSPWKHVQEPVDPKRDPNDQENVAVHIPSTLFHNDSRITHPRPDTPSSYPRPFC